MFIFFSVKHSHIHTSYFMVRKFVRTAGELLLKRLFVSTIVDAIKTVELKKLMKKRKKSVIFFSEFHSIFLFKVLFFIKRKFLSCSFCKICSRTAL